jgi:hypothetical protein
MLSSSCFFRRRCQDALSLRAHSRRWSWASSLLFYVWSSGAPVVLLLANIVMNFGGGLVLEEERCAETRRTLLAVLICADVAADPVPFSALEDLMLRRLDIFAIATQNPARGFAP